MLKFFRLTAILEGITYLGLFAFTMPLKYWAEIGQPNKWVGYAHGVLFILYILLLIFLAVERKWSIKKTILLFIASLLPFGTFYAEKKYLQNT